MQIKLQLGKLRLTVPLERLIENQQRTNHIEVLPVTLPHVFALKHLPAHHKDPFDRLLVAQTNAEGAVLVSNDSVLDRYGVTRLW
jgi:PIN domain nuclease of toxin-antitoxin system